MNTCLRKAGLLASLFLFLLVNTAWADLTIGNYTLVSSKRVSRVEYEYTYRAQVSNDGQNVKNVMAQVTSNSPHTTIVKGILDFGNVAAGSSVTSSDTFIIKHDRRYPLDWSALVWDIQAEHLLSAESEIGSNGGTIEISNGAKIVIPAGFFSQNEIRRVSIKEIPISDINLNENYHLIGGVYDISIDGYNNHEDLFNLPLKITLPFESTITSWEDGLPIVYVGTIFSDGNVEFLNQKYIKDIDIENGLITYNAYHLSDNATFGCPPNNADCYIRRAYKKAVDFYRCILEDKNKTYFDFLYETTGKKEEIEYVYRFIVEELDTMPKAESAETYILDGEEYYSNPRNIPLLKVDLISDMIQTGIAIKNAEIELKQNGISPELEFLIGRVADIISDYTFETIIGISIPYSSLYSFIFDLVTYYIDADNLEKFQYLVEQNVALLEEIKKEQFICENPTEYYIAHKSDNEVAAIRSWGDLRVPGASDNCGILVPYWNYIPILLYEYYNTSTHKTEDPNFFYSTWTVPREGGTVNLDILFNIFENQNKIMFAFGGLTVESFYNSRLKNPYAKLVIRQGTSIKEEIIPFLKRYSSEDCNKILGAYFQYLDLDTSEYPVEFILLQLEDFIITSSSPVFKLTKRAKKIWFKDADNDGYSDGTAITAHDKPSSEYFGEDDLLSISGDCNDNDPFTFPGAAELENQTDCMTDADDDGYGSANPAEGAIAGNDSNDNNATVFPYAPELCDGIDNDLDGEIDEGCDSPNMGFLAHYTFDNNLNDISGNGHNAINNNGATFTEDRFGNSDSAIYFNGASYIDFDIAGLSIDTYTTAYSISGWFKPLSSSAYFVLIGFDDGGDTTFAYGLTSPFWDSDSNKLFFYHGLRGQHPIGSAILVQDQWHHFVGIGYTDGSTRLYIDGQYAGSGTYPHARGPINYFRMGGNDNMGRYFNGSLDDLRIYKRALIETEIQALYGQEGAYEDGTSGACDICDAFIGTWHVVESNVLDTCGSNIVAKAFDVDITQEGSNTVNVTAQGVSEAFALNDNTLSRNPDPYSAVDLDGNPGTITDNISITLTSNTSFTGYKESIWNDSTNNYTCSWRKDLSGTKLP